MFRRLAADYLPTWQDLVDVTVRHRKAMVLSYSAFVFLFSLGATYAFLFWNSMAGGKGIFVAASVLLGPSLVIPYSFTGGSPGSGFEFVVYFGVIGIGVPIQNCCYCMLAGWPYKKQHTRVAINVSLVLIVLIHIMCGVLANEMFSMN